MLTVVALHHRAVGAARTVLDRVTPADLDRPTPCAGWDLRALLEHMAGQDHGFATAVTAARRGAGTDLAAFAPRALGASPAATLASTLDEVGAAFSGVEELQRTVLLPEFDVRVPAPVLVSMHLVDTLVHGWDVAAGLDVVEAYLGVLDAELVEAGLAIAEQVADDESREAPGAPFRHAVPAPADADAWTRLLTSLGRDPAWTADRADRVSPRG
ncbi:TIGR03086 family metal-binding protein [Pseudonocardia sp. RS11V-5]|uniref:TIGR03086 family metal-binding protein n=1 Tax=Pseudonocardia terrae TaxID=2905831 RepID=UPI001E487F23|nr:TIGR03086 family metal-binding protein [Pseudonocardia terrae]MCE3554068.1 TIGR03086 family metal-binding protein [Pseudonocardia terrae]